MPCTLLVRSRNYHRRRPGFRPLEMELLEARLPPGEGMLGFLLAAAWLEPSIAVVDPDLTPVRSHDDAPSVLDPVLSWETRPDSTAAEPRGTSPNLRAAAGPSEPISALDGDSLWVGLPASGPFERRTDIPVRPGDADRIFAAEDTSASLNTIAGAWPPNSMVARFMCNPASAESCLPTMVEPVKEILRITGCGIRYSEISAGTP